VIPPAGALVPKGNITAPRSTDPLVSDGYWAMIPPLAAGTYEIKIVARTSSGATVQDLLYTISVP
jgi:hypothetical protein